MNKHTPGSGDIEIELDGEAVVLRPTLKAAMALTNMQGGIPSLVNRCLSYELDAFIRIIQVGLDINSKDIPEKVYRTGMTELAPMCIRYLHVLARGGRPLDDDEDEAETVNDPLVPTSSQ